MTDKIHLYNVDCMEFMRDKPDKFYQMGIVDPPFGLNDLTKNKNGRHRNNPTTYKNKEIPSKEYFEQLERICERTIIFGCQYYLNYMNPEGSFIIWDKLREPDLCNASACDVAWYSKRERIRIFRGIWNGAVKIDNEQTIHPHQKSLALYKWLLKHYANSGDKILDTHAGSFSIGVACHDYGFSLDACELDKDYYEAACKRFKNHIAQTKLFPV